VKQITYVAIDACGNESEPVSYTITVLDTTDPVLVGLPAETLVLDCDDEVPAPPVVTAEDNCDNDVTVEYSGDVIIGDEGLILPEGASSICALSTPVGDFCDNNDPWAVHLFNFPAGIEFFTAVSGSWTEYPDGTARIQAEVVSTAYPDGGLIADAWFENGVNWEEWDNQPFPTDYKDDCDQAGDEYLNWMYYIMTSGQATLTGTGSLSGTFLNLTHTPANKYFAYQVGTAANNMTTGFGSGGWFNANGVLVVNEEEFSISNLSGDFAFDHDCCPQYQIERTWTATDCSGNTTSFTQLISFEDLPEGTGKPIGGNLEAIFEVSKQVVSGLQLKSYPNPAVNTAILEFANEVTENVTVEVFDIAGNRVKLLFNQRAENGVEYRLELDASNMANGMYFYRVTTPSAVKTERFMIQK
jgi:hypothetical protein